MILRNDYTYLEVPGEEWNGNRPYTSESLEPEFTGIEILDPSGNSVKELTCQLEKGYQPYPRYRFFDGEQDLGTGSGALNRLIGEKLTHAKLDAKLLSGASIDQGVMTAIEQAIQETKAKHLDENPTSLGNVDTFSLEERVRKTHERFMQDLLGQANNDALQGERPEQAMVAAQPSTAEQEASANRPFAITANDLKAEGGLTEEKWQEVEENIRNALATPALQQRENQLAISRRGMLNALATSLSTIQEKPALPEFSTPLETATMPLGSLTTAQFLEQYMFLYAIMEKASRGRVEDLAYHPTGTTRRTRNALPVSHFVEIGLTIQPGEGERSLIPYYAIRGNSIIDAPRSKSTDPVPSREERAHEILAYMQKRAKDAYATGTIVNDNPGIVRI